MSEETEIEIGVPPIVEEIKNDIGANAIAEAIGAAEHIPDPLDGLVKRCKSDAGAPFEPESSNG